MTRWNAFGLVLFVSMSLLPKEVWANEGPHKKSDELVVLWTSGDREVAEKMVLMFVAAAPKHGFWEAQKMTLLVWGPSAKLLSKDKELQNTIREIKKSGVNLLACKACADQYGVSADLEALGITVRYAGKDLAKFLREDRRILTL